MIDNDEMRRLARVGIEMEIERLRGLLGELEGPKAHRVRVTPEVSSDGNGDPSGGNVKARRTMSPAARHAIARRMKAYWAEKRKKASK